MGASGWEHFVPYQADINAALQKIRNEIFERGDYFKLDHSDLRAMSEDEVRKKFEGIDPDIFEIYIDDWRMVKRLHEPDTMEHLLEWNIEAGTHSIIDIYKGVSEQPQFGTVSPLTDAQLIENFGTAYPTHQQIETSSLQETLPNFRERWEGIYIIVYENDVPVEICFTGFSGD